MGTWDTHQSLAGTEGCCPDCGALLQNCAPQMAGWARGSHHLHMGKVPVSLLHDIAIGKKFPVDRQIEKQVFFFVWNSVVHLVLRAAHSSLPPAAGDRMTQSVRQKMPAGIYLDWPHHVIFRQGLDKMFCKKRKQSRIQRPKLSVSETNRLPFGAEFAKPPLPWSMENVSPHTKTVNMKLPEQLTCA